MSIIEEEIREQRGDQDQMWKIIKSDLREAKADMVNKKVDETDISYHNGSAFHPTRMKGHQFSAEGVHIHM